MPTLCRIDGCRVVIDPNDHRPAHIHVIGAGGEAVFVLNCPDGPPNLRESFGFNSKQLSRLRDGLLAGLDGLCESWRERHGAY